MTHYNPELFAFYEWKKQVMPDGLTIDKVWHMITDHYLTNLRVISDLFLNVEDKEYNLYNVLNPEFYSYIKYIAIEEGFSGFWIQKKVGEYIEGYYDDLVSDIKSMPFEQGGDPTADNWISIADK